jgi:RimJ/RimL family protein N-acetyltransferase
MSLTSLTSGFKEEGRIRKHNWKDGQWVDTLYMGILDDEWQ